MAVSSVTFTVVPDVRLEPNKPARSIDITAIRDNATYAKEGIYAEEIVSATFTANGTWTKPVSSLITSQDTVLVQIWGGGASGSRSGPLSGDGVLLGGNAGQYLEIAIPYADAPSSAAVVVGAGGAARTTSQAGETGGASEWGDFKAYGGEVDIDTSSNGVVSDATVDALTSSFDAYALQKGGAAWQDGLITRGISLSGRAYFGLDGEGSNNGYASGAGGSWNNGVGRNDTRTGGTSYIGGAGGDARNGSNADAGSAPGGGGGACISADSGAGARGEVRVTVLRGRHPANVLTGI